ncbi:hypothetical protein [Streptomyces mirabilis]|uniref:hypothetical protein n=1 Tax=Streptomyces mirabilis TaxID=68239 RepID=UPI0033284FC1
MSPWASDVEVVTIGCGENLPQLLPTARIAHMRQAEHALRDLSERLLEAHQIPETRHQPYLLLCASALDADPAWEFADVIDKAGTVPVALAAPASTAAAHFPEAEILNASLNEPQQLDYAGAEITVQRLEHAAYLQITTALKVSWQPSHMAEGPWQAPETDAGEDSGEEGTAQEVEESEAYDLHKPEIRALGPVEVTGVDSTGHGRLQGLRRSLGSDPANPYVPRRSSGDGPCRPAVRRQAPALGRALPAGDDHLIIDVTHTVVAYRTLAGPHHDLSAARQAVATGLGVDDAAELPYRD